MAKQLNILVGVGVVVGSLLLAACNRAEEVVKPYSSLQIGLQLTATPVPESEVTTTPKPWPTSAVAAGLSPTVTLVGGVPTATSAAMTTQPQTGLSSLALGLVVGLIGLGAVLLTMGIMPSQRR